MPSALRAAVIRSFQFIPGSVLKIKLGMPLENRLTRLLGAPSILGMNDEANKVIDYLGGSTAVARMCDIKTPSVCEWRHKGLPKPWRKYLMCAHPEAFGLKQKKRSKERRGE